MCRGLKTRLVAGGRWLFGRPSCCSGQESGRTSKVKAKGSQRADGGAEHRRAGPRLENAAFLPRTDMPPTRLRGVGDYGPKQGRRGRGATEPCFLLGLLGGELHQLAGAGIAISQQESTQLMHTGGVPPGSGISRSTTPGRLRVVPVVIFHPGGSGRAALHSMHAGPGGLWCRRRNAGSPALEVLRWGRGSQVAGRRSCMVIRDWQ